MKIDASYLLGQGGVKIKTGSGSAADSLSAGDVIRAEVISGDKKGNLTLKLDNGQSFSAKLGTDIKLSPGDSILLEVTSKEKGQISLSFSGIEASDDLSAGQTSLVRDFSDKTLAPYASKLAELKMPVTEEAARIMRDVVAQNPGLSLEEAAFLASNKLAGNESLMKAALSSLAGGDKTDAMIMRLISMMNEQSVPIDSGLPARGLTPEINSSMLSNTASLGEGIPAFNANTANSVPLTELITMIVKNLTGSFATAERGEAILAQETRAIITQNGSVLQTNAENVEELLQFQGKQDGITAHSDSFVQTRNMVGATRGEASAGVTSGVAGSAVGQQKAEAYAASGVLEHGAISDGQAEAAAKAATAQQSAAAQSAANQAAAAAGSQTQPNAASDGQSLSSMSNVVAQVLADIPEFSGTPQSALQRFSEMLLRVAGETPEAVENKETLMAQLDKLFTRIGKDDADAGTRLRDARQELYTRLTLIEEAISRVAQPARAELLAQTQKLMDHVRLLNSIDQFVYMQMPVQLGEQRKAADLYVFKRKGRGRADPENVNILLAIDLEFMGHWEALVNIKNKEVSIQMEVPGENEKEHFNANSVLLHNMLSDAGFKLVSTNIKFAEKETTPLTALSTFDRYTGGKQGIIDFMI